MSSDPPCSRRRYYFDRFRRQALRRHRGPRKWDSVPSCGSPLEKSKGKSIYRYAAAARAWVVSAAPNRVDDRRPSPAPEAVDACATRQGHPAHSPVSRKSPPGHPASEQRLLGRPGTCSHCPRATSEVRGGNRSIEFLNQELVDTKHLGYCFSRPAQRRCSNSALTRRTRRILQVPEIARNRSVCCRDSRPPVPPCTGPSFSEARPPLALVTIETYRSDLTKCEIGSAAPVERSRSHFAISASRRLNSGLARRSSPPTATSASTSSPLRAKVVPIRSKNRLRSGVKSVNDTWMK